MIKNITIIVEPYPSNDPDFKGYLFPPAETAHESVNYIQFERELQSISSAKVTLVKGFLQEAPLQGIVFLYPRLKGLDFEKSLKDCNPELRVTLPQRLVLLNIVYPDWDELLNQYGLLAVVNDFQHSYWWNVEVGSRNNSQEIHGLISVAQQMDAIMAIKRGKYCTIHGNDFERLPALLLRYLETYTRMTYDKSEI